MSISRSHVHAGLANQDGPQALALPRERTSHGWQEQLRRALFWLFLIGLGLLLVSVNNGAGKPGGLRTGSSLASASVRFGGFGAAGGPCHPLANGAANPADQDPACRPADPQQCPHPPPSGPVPAACIPVYQAALEAPPSPNIAGMACHPLPSGEANPYDSDPACGPADPVLCHRFGAGPPPDQRCLPAYLVALSQPPLRGTDCHPLANREANPADEDPACRPADPVLCHRLPINEIGPYAPACGFAGPLPGLSQANSPNSPDQEGPGISPPPVNTGNPLEDNFWSGLGQLVADFWNQVLDWLGSFTFMLQTPKDLSYGHFVVVAGYHWSLEMTSALTALILTMQGYRLLREGMRGRAVAWLWADLIWELVAALCLAWLGFPLISQAIELSNQMARGILFALGVSSAGGLGFSDLFAGLRTITAPLAWIVFVVFSLVVLILMSLTRLVQIALLDILLILLPIWALAWATPGWRPYGRLAFTLVGELLLSQILQDAAIGLGTAFIAGVGHASATPISLLVGLAACYLAFKIPALLARATQAALAGLPSPGEQLAALLALWL